MTEFEYFDNWFKSKFDDSNSLHYLKVNNFKIDNWGFHGAYSIRPCEPNGFSYGRIDKDGLRVFILGYTTLEQMQSDEHAKWAEDIKASIKEWYAGVMENYYLNEELSATLTKNTNNKKKVIKV